MTLRCLRVTDRYLVARSTHSRNDKGPILQLHEYDPSTKTCVPSFEIKQRHKDQVVTDAQGHKIATFRGVKSPLKSDSSELRTIEVVSKNELPMTWHIEHSARNVLFSYTMMGTKTTTLCWTKRSRISQPRETSPQLAASFENQALPFSGLGSSPATAQSKDWVCSVLLPDMDTAMRDPVARLTTGKLIMYTLPCHSRAITPAMIKRCIIASISWMLCHIVPESTVPQSVRLAGPVPPPRLRTRSKPLPHPTTTKASKAGLMQASSRAIPDPTKPQTSRPTVRTFLQSFRCLCPYTARLF